MVMELLEKVELVREKCGVSYEEARVALEAHDGDVLDAIVAIERGEVPATVVEPVEAAVEEPEPVEAAAEEPEPVEAAAEEPEASEAMGVAEAVVEAGAEAVGSIDEVVAATEAAVEAVAEVLGEEAHEAVGTIPVADDPASAEPAPETAPEPQAYVQAAERAQRREARRSKVRGAWRSFWSQCAGILRSGIDMTFVAMRHDEVMFSLPVLFLVIGMLAWGATLWLLVIGLFFGFRYRIDGASPVTVDVNRVMDRAADLADDIKNDVA